MIHTKARARSKSTAYPVSPRRVRHGSPEAWGPLGALLLGLVVLGGLASSAAAGALSCEDDCWEDFEACEAGYCHPYEPPQYCEWCEDELEQCLCYCQPCNQNDPSLTPNAFSEWHSEPPVCTSDPTGVYWLELEYVTTARTLIDGEDGGHEDSFCVCDDTPQSACCRFRRFDGLKLKPDPSGAWVRRSYDSFLGCSIAFPEEALIVASIDGPKQKEGGSDWEWDEDDDYEEAGAYSWALREYPLIELTSSQVPGYDCSANPVQRYCSPYVIRWDEGEGGWPAADDFNWYHNFADDVARCMRHSSTWPSWRTISTDRTLRLCDTRGCDDGEFFVVYDVRCRMFKRW